MKKKLNMSIFLLYVALIISFSSFVLSQDSESSLDFTTGALETIGPIQAKADKPQVIITAVRVVPQFKKFEIEERNFVGDVLKTAHNKELHKRFNEKIFFVVVPPIE